MTYDRGKPWTAAGARADRRSLDLQANRHEAVDEGSVRKLRGMNSHFPHMFTDDVQNKVFPIGGEIRKTRSPIAVLSVEGADAGRIEQMATFAFGTAAFGRDGSFSDAFAEWARKCTYSLVREGRAWYELALLRAEDSRPPVGFRIFHVYSGRVQRRYKWFGEYVQTIPANSVLRDRYPYQEQPRKPPPSVILGGPSRVIEVSLPGALRAFHQAAIELAAIGPTTLPSFMMPPYASESGKRIPYDFDEFRRTEQIAVASATRHVGWYGRGSFGDAQTEYYSIARRLQFERSLQGLRAHLAASANRILALAGKELGFRAHLELKGLSTAADVDEASTLLAEGRIGPAKLLERFHFY